MKFESRDCNLVLLQERYDLSAGRIEQMRGERVKIDAPFLDYFHKTSSFLYELYRLYEKIEQGFLEEATEEDWSQVQELLYSELREENYEKSYANPSYSVTMLGEEFGGILSFLYAEGRAQIVSVYEQRKEELVNYSELFLEIYSLMQDKVGYEEVRKAIYWHMSDYAEQTVAYRVRENLDPSLDFAVRIVMDSDLSDLRYLYRYGEYIGENEKKMAMYWNHLPEEMIEKMASVYTGGYAKGFEAKGVDLSKKSFVNLRYSIGQERLVRAAIQQFEKMGLSPIIYRYVHSSIHKKQNVKIGYFSSSVNKQYEYDHQADQAFYVDKAFMQRKLDVLKLAYEEQRENAAGFAGPACIETFGEEPFSPIEKREAAKLSEEQQKLSIWYTEQSAKIMNQYINQEERSFTIIAYPTPEIGDKFEEIFLETVKINNLDQQRYAKIQQHLIDALDQADRIRIQGRGKNKTDLIVKMQELKDSNRQTNFENCLADVNIPVGEVFTSPQLAGTEGILHVTGIYLDELFYQDLELIFQDGRVVSYRCANFDTEEENKTYVKENVLFHHETLPLGEFAIGTNTTAYQMAKQYHIFHKLPILIAEKMGPHFAVGDTCYSYCEDIPVFNPDGKEMTAKDNFYTAKRKYGEEPEYFHCHTDITIPYDELGLIEVITKDGKVIELIKDSRFVLEGTKELNLPLEQL